MEERGGTVIITGAGGFIGSSVARRLAGDFRVVGFDLGEPKKALPHVEYQDVDVTSEDSVRRGLEAVRQGHGDRIASVVHLAAYYDFSGEPSPKYEEITVGGTERLLRHLRASFNVEQFLFSSTMLVHAPSGPGRPINEESPIEPRWVYPESKAKTEALIREQRGNIPVLIMRIAGVYDDLCHSIGLAHQVQRIHERSVTSRLFSGEITHGQAYVHLDDVAEAIFLAVQRRRELAPETAMLIGEPDVLSYDDLQRALGWLIHGEEWETREVPKALAKAGAWIQEAVPWGEDPFIKPFMIDIADDHYELDITRARTLLGWEPRHRLRDALPGMIQALKNDPAAWYRANKLTLPEELERRAA